MENLSLFCPNTENPIKKTLLIVAETFLTSICNLKQT